MINESSFVCLGCGRTVEIESEQKKDAFLDKKIDFMSEVIGIIDNTYPKEGIVSSEVSDSLSIDVSKIAFEEGIMIIEGEKYRDVEEISAYRAFLGDILCSVLFPLVFALGFDFIIHVDLIALIKVYFVAYFIVSFFIWFLFPLLAESSPAAFLFHDFIIIKGEF